MGYQKGDGRISLDGKDYSLRLTMGALAEISSGLSKFGQRELAATMRKLTPSDSMLILACLIRASGTQAPDGFSNEALADALPELCRVFEEAFGETAP